jgi:Na+-driven multidrug efflux pump
MRITMVFFPLVGLQIVTSNFFQSIGRAKISILLSLSRQVAFLIPALIVLPRLFGLKGVWAALPASDLCAVLLCVFVLKQQNRKMAQPLA